MTLVSTASPRVGRDGHLRLGFERRGTRTVVTRAEWAIPLQVLAPVDLDGCAAVASILNPTGGLVGGDTLAIEVDVGPGAHAIVTTPSAAKVYRTAGDESVQRICLRLAEGATLEWVPDHTIPFPGSALRQTIEADLGDGATLVLVDAFAAGRVARGETWRFRRLESALSIRDARGWLAHDRFALRAGAWDALGHTERHPYFASIAVLGDAGIDEFTREVDAMSCAGAVAVLTLPRRGALVRALAPDAPALEAIVSSVWESARRATLGSGPFALRKR